MLSHYLLCLQHRALQTKVIHLEKDKRELEQSLQMLKRSQERVDSENQNMKQKLTEQLHSYRKEVAKLKEVPTVCGTIVKLLYSRHLRKEKSVLICEVS